MFICFVPNVGKQILWLMLTLRLLHRLFAIRVTLLLVRFVKPVSVITHLASIVYFEICGFLVTVFF